ncbi:STAS domain-containing protein [Bacillus sp. ISL-18]|nr:STAS domain-containing protein [Bacillus sp. ISL-18]
MLGYNCYIEEYIINNKDEFKTTLLSEAVQVAPNINDILQKGNIDLPKNAEKIARYVVTNNKKELSSFAEVEGIAWASNSLTLAFKLEWIHAIRRTLWHFLHKLYYDKSVQPLDDFFKLEQMINDGIDEFLNTFFIAYSKYKDNLILSQRKLVEHLSVPIIPVSPAVAVLPLIGTSDTYRMKIIEEKVLNEISMKRIQTLIIDLSGISDMDEVAVAYFEKILIGVNMMGARSILTGLRPELVRKMVNIGINLDRQTETKGTLQQTLSELLGV